MIKTINGWRALFALMIVVFHVGATSFEEMTWAGVTFFFMASGFLLAMKHPFKQLDGASWRRFAWNHAVKLFPLHWLTLALWLVAMALLGLLVIKPLALTLNATLLHSWSLTHSIYFSYNKFSWFLSTLLFCYLCYPLLARWFAPLRLRHKGIILIVLAIIDFIVLAGTDDYGRTALYVFPPVRLIDFAIGITLAHVCQWLKGSRVLGKSANGTDAELVAVALLSVMVMTCQSYDSLLPWTDAILWWLPIAAILVACRLYDRREGFIGKILASKPLQRLGDISFEIFMLQGIAALVYNYWIAPVMAHLGVQYVYNEVAADLLGTSAPELIVWLILPVDILLAWAVNRLFTRPVTRLLRRD